MDGILCVTAVVDIFKTVKKHRRNYEVLLSSTDAFLTIYKPLAVVLGSTNQSYTFTVTKVSDGASKKISTCLTRCNVLRDAYIVVILLYTKSPLNMKAIMKTCEEYDATYNYEFDYLPCKKTPSDQEKKDESGMRFFNVIGKLFTYETVDAFYTNNINATSSILFAHFTIGTHLTEDTNNYFTIYMKDINNVIQFELPIGYYEEVDEYRKHDINFVNLLNQIDTTQCYIDNVTDGANKNALYDSVLTNDTNMSTDINILKVTNSCESRLSLKCLDYPDRSPANSKSSDILQVIEMKKRVKIAAIKLKMTKMINITNLAEMLTTKIDTIIFKLDKCIEIFIENKNENIYSNEEKKLCSKTKCKTQNKVYSAIPLSEENNECEDCFNSVEAQKAISLDGDGIKLLSQIKTNVELVKYAAKRKCNQSEVAAMLICNYNKKIEFCKHYGIVNMYKSAKDTLLKMKEVIKYKYQL